MDKQTREDAELKRDLARIKHAKETFCPVLNGQCRSNCASLFGPKLHSTGDCRWGVVSNVVCRNPNVTCQARPVITIPEKPKCET